MNDDPLGPKNLGKLFGMVKSHVENKQAAAQVAKSQELPPTRHCQICGVMHSPGGILFDHAITAAPCQKCQEHLDKGEIAIVCDKSVPPEFCFVFCPPWSEGLKAKAKNILESQIVFVTMEAFDQLKAEVEARRSAANPDTETQGGS